MTMSIEELWSMPEPALIGTYHGARREFVEKKFARDTQRARLEWMKAKMFVSSTGGVTERKMAIDVSEELARKGQELREMTRDLDLLKVDVDTIAMVIRLRGVSAAAGGRSGRGGRTGGCRAVLRCCRAKWLNWPCWDAAWPRPA